MTPAGKSSVAEEKPAVGDAQAEPVRELLEDLEELLIDGRTWFDAEVTYQKSRASFIGSSMGQAIAFAFAGAIVAIVMVIALSIGLVLALAPLITTWGATAVVTVTLGVIALMLVSTAKRRWNDVRDAMREDDGG